MFYYISFLRPPPLEASITPTEPIPITPQISNDLRTEFLDDPIDIYYAWSLHGAPTPTLTKPTKLTSWRPSTAYKTIPVPRPPSNHVWRDKDKDGSAWRLVLTCGTTKDDQIIHLGDTFNTGTSPFPVTSMPVHFPNPRQPGLGAKGVKSTKQERIARSYAIDILHSDNPIIFDVIEQTSFDLDKKIWDSGIGLSSWLVQLFSRNGVETDGAASDLHDSLFGTGPRHILELGAGTGIVAITLAVLRSTLDLSDHPGSIVTTDLPSALPILQENIISNHALMHTCMPQAAVLDWEIDAFPEPVRAQLDAGLDVIVMADVTYNTASFSALIRTLSRLLRCCKEKQFGRSPKVLIGYKERHPDERSLWVLAKDIGIHFQRIAQVKGAGGNSVEIWLG